MDTPRSIPSNPSWGSIYTTLSAPHRVVEVDALAVALLSPTTSLPDVVSDHRHLSLMASMLLGKKITDLLGPDHKHNEHSSCQHQNHNNNNNNNSNNNNSTTTTTTNHNIAKAKASSQPAPLPPALCSPSPPPSPLSVSLSLPLSLAAPSELSWHVIPLRSIIGGPAHRQRRVLCIISVSPDDPPRRHYMVCAASSTSASSLPCPLGHAQTGEVGCLGEAKGGERVHLPMVRRHSLLPSLPNAARVTIATRPSVDPVNAILKTTSTPTTTPEAPAAAATTTTSFMRDSLSSPAAQGARVHRRCLSGMIPSPLFSCGSSTWPQESSSLCSSLPSPSLLPCPTFALPNNINSTDSTNNNNSSSNNSNNNTSKESEPTSTVSPATTIDLHQHSNNTSVPLFLANGHVHRDSPGQGSVARDNPPAKIMMMHQQLPRSSRTPLPNNSFSSYMVNNAIGGGEPLSNLPVAPPPLTTASAIITTTSPTTPTATTTTTMTPRTSCSHSSSSSSHAHAYAHRKGSMHRRYSDTWNDPTGVNMVIDHPPLMSPSPSPTPPAFPPSPTMSSTLLVLQVTRFGTVDNAFTLTPPPPHAAQHGSVPYASPRDQVLFTLAAIEDALPGSSPSSPAPKPFASFSSNHSSSSLFYSLDRHERDSFLSTFRAEAVVGGGSFLGQSDTQIRNSVATSIMATVHTDDVRVLCAGLDKVCKDQMATWQIRWSVQGADKMVLKHHDASYPSTKQNQDYDDAKPKPMGRLFEYQGEWFEEWQDPTALVPSYPEKYDDDDDMDEDGNLIDDDWQYRWTEITGIAGAGSLLTLVVRPMSDEELYDEAEETGSTAHMVIEGARSGGSISSSVGHHGSQYEEQAHRYQKKQQRRRERMAREESLSWIHNQSSGPMRPLTDSTISGTDAAAAALAFTPSGQESRHRRRRQSISGGSSSSISSICSSSSLLMVPCSPQEHALYWRLHYHHHQRRESDFSEDGYSSSEEHIRYSYYVVDPMAHPEIPRGPHMPDAFAHQRPDSHALVRRMSSSSSSAWNDASWPASRAMSNCSSVVVRHAPPNQHQYAHQFPPQHQQHQYLLTAGNNSNNNNNNSSSGWQVTSLPSVMSLPSQTLPPWNVLTTIALEAWQTWIQTIHAGKEQFQSWCEYVVELAIDQTIDNFMMAFHVVGWITGSSALMVVRSSSSNTASSSSSSSIKRVTQGECQSEQQQQQRKQEQTSQQMLRHKGSRSSLPSFSVSRRDSLAASCPEAAMWPPRQIRSKATPEWLQRHLQMRRRRRRQLQQQAAGDATILEEMEEEVEEEEDEAQEDQDEMEKINNDISVTAAATATTTATTASTVVSTIGDSTQQRPQRPGLHRRYWSTNNAPQLHSSKPEETPSSLPSLPPTQSQPVPPSSLTPLKPNGMERAGKLLDEVPVVGRMTRYVGGSWVGKKIKGRLELQQDRIDGVLDQVVDWIEVAATALPIPATITALARRGTSK